MPRVGEWMGASVVLVAYSSWLVCGSDSAWRVVGAAGAPGKAAAAEGTQEAVARSAAAGAKWRALSGLDGPERSDDRGRVFGPPGRSTADGGRAGSVAGGERRGGGDATGGDDADGDGFAALGALEPSLGGEPALAEVEIPDPSRATSPPSRAEDEEAGSEPAFAEAQGKLLAWNVSGEKDGSYPWVAGEIGAQLEYLSYFAASNPEYERDNWVTNLLLDQMLNLSERLSVQSGIRVVLESDGEDERFYSDWPYEGVYLVELMGKYEGEYVSVFGGKYEPAADIRGYGPIFFGNYSRNLVLDRRLGGGASVTLDSDALGAHTLTGHLFRMDTTRLRGEIISNRWREDEFLESAGDIGWPTSYLVTVHGTPPVGETLELHYTLGGGEQTRGERPDERMLIAALLGKVPIEGVGSVYASIDALDLRNAAGYPEDRKVLEPGLGLATPWFYVGAAYSQRHARPHEGESRVDRITEVVGRYYLSRRSILEAAYQHYREWGAVGNAFGISLTYWADWIVH